MTVMTPQHLSHSGHICLVDGSVLRLDFECQRWAARWFRPDLSLQAYAWGGREQMEAIVNSWSDAFAASLASAVVGTGGGPGPVTSNPTPGQTTLGEAS